MYGATVFVPSQKGYLNTSFGSIDEKEDERNLDELDLPTDFKDLPVRIDWSAELPANIVVPRVDLHSLILDFAAVSFLDISALKELKTVSCNPKHLGIITCCHNPMICYMRYSPLSYQRLLF